MHIYIYILLYYGDMTHAPESREMQVSLLIFTRVLSYVHICIESLYFAYRLFQHLSQPFIGCCL